VLLCADCCVCARFIQRALKRTPVAGTVAALYGGVTTTALMCMTCKTTRQRHDALLDVPLTVRDVLTVQAALRGVCGYEELVGSNRLTCDVCGGRHDAARSVRLGRRRPAATDSSAAGVPADATSDDIVDVPQLLWLPLSRFDYDRERGARVKLSTPFLVRVIRARARVCVCAHAIT
jgi:hypothetical protein